MTVNSDNSPTTRNPGRLRRTADYRAMRGARRYQAAAFTLQVRRRSEAAGGEEARFGLTVTRKIGNAVERNRIRRRLREAVRKCAPSRARPHHDYVLIARREALSEPFAAIVGQLAKALDRASLSTAHPGRLAGRHRRRDDRISADKEG